jgi:hypothetical protein
MEADAVPVGPPAVNFSPIPLMAPPPFGWAIAGSRGPEALLSLPVAAGAVLLFDAVPGKDMLRQRANTGLSKMLSYSEKMLSRTR